MPEREEQKRSYLPTVHRERDGVTVYRYGLTDSTNLRAKQAAAEGIEAAMSGKGEVKSLQEYHATIS